MRAFGQKRRRGWQWLPVLTAALMLVAAAAWHSSGGAAPSHPEPHNVPSEVLPTAAPAVPTPKPSRSPQEQLVQTLCRAAAECRQTLELQATEGEFLRSYEELEDCPEAFWVNGSTYTCYPDGRMIVTLKSRYDQLPQRMEEVRRAADEILAGIPEGASDYDKALYLYDWLIQNIVYTSRPDSMDQGIYAALVEKACVCDGYSKAFAYLLQRLEILAGTVDGVAGGGRHAWNWAVLEGATYYFDPTWDDPLNNEHPEFLRHSWFGVTMADMQLAHTPQDYTEAPAATARACNYFVKNGWWLEEYSKSRVKKIFEAQLCQGVQVLQLRCADAQVWKQTMDALMEQDQVFDILEDLGRPVQRISYSCEEQLGILYIFL